MYIQTLRSVLPYLNYDIQSCQVAVLLGSDNPEDKKKKIRKPNKYELMSCFYSFQYIVFSLTARRTGEVYCVLSLVILHSKPLLLTGRTAATGRTTAADELTLCPHIYRLPILGPKIKRVIQTNEGVGSDLKSATSFTGTWTLLLQRVQHKL